jgi:signal transduction histidine kinase
MNEIIWTMNHEEDTLDSLISYIRANAAEALDTAGIGYRFQVADPVPDTHVSQEFRRNIYLILKEAVHNVIRHANADKVVISFIIDRRLEITIQDNGKGFDGGEDRRFGNGLKNMRRRAKDIGGELTIQDQEGTRLRLTVPLPV